MANHSLHGKKQDPERVWYGPDNVKIILNGPEVVKYDICNETLPAIMEGLDIREGDRILAICGSGDQAFAMLEHAERVVAFDCDRKQVNLLRRRMRQVQSGDSKGFYSVTRGGREKHLFDQRTNYFKEDRLERIRQRLDGLQVFAGNLYSFPLLGQPSFDRVYLSNALGHTIGRDSRVGSVVRCDHVLSAARSIVDSLEPDGLLYLAADSYGHVLEKLPLRLELELTERARDIEANSPISFMKWKPTVYRKVEES